MLHGRFLADRLKGLSYLFDMDRFLELNLNGDAACKIYPEVYPPLYRIRRREKTSITVVNA